MALDQSLALVRPELVLSFSSLALLLIAAWRSESGRFISILSVAALVAAAAFAAQIFCSGVSTDAFGGLYRADSFGSFAKILIYIAAAIALVAFAYVGRTQKFHLTVTHAELQPGQSGR